MAVKMHEVKSSNIESVGHDGDHLHVKFKGSDTYVYETYPRRCLLQSVMRIRQALRCMNTSKASSSTARQATMTDAPETEATIQELVDGSPEPLRNLGTYLAGILDDDHFNQAEVYLLAIARLFRQSGNKVLRSSAEWLQQPKYAGIVVSGPAGWEPRYFDAVWAERVDEAEFERRLSIFTVTLKPKG